MFFNLFNSLKGSVRILAHGKFPERVLNTASTSGIYVHDVIRKDEENLLFSVSKKGADKLLSCQIEALTLTATEKSGLFVALNRHKRRIILLVLPAIFLIFTFIFSLFVWRVEIIGGDEELRTQVKKVISKNGVYPGALKKNIDHYEIKRTAITNIENLAWLWVNIEGTTATVKVQKRVPVPELIKTGEPSDVISTHTGVIEKMQVYCGIPLFSEGLTVEKGQVIVTGVLRSENENIPTYYHHATADVILRSNESKTYIIPKKILVKTPTGNKKSVFGINFKKNNIKFSLNSGISYTEYDKIEKIIKIPLLPVSLFKQTYLEVCVTEKANDTEAQKGKHKTAFTNSLAKKDVEIITLSESAEETDTSLKVTFTAEYRVKADKEIPISKGEQNGKNN